MANPASSIDIGSIIRAIPRSPPGLISSEELHTADQLLRLLNEDRKLWHDVFIHIRNSLPTAVSNRKSQEEGNLGSEMGSAALTANIEATRSPGETLDGKQTKPRLNLSSKGMCRFWQVFTKRGRQDLFLKTVFAFVDTDDIMYFGQSYSRPGDLSLQEISKSLKLIPDEELYPKLPPHLTLAPTTPNNNYYLKRPKMSAYEDLQGKGLLPKLLLEEAKTLEFLQRHPHPNLAQYVGCVANRGLIIGLAFVRYPVTLLDLANEELKLNRESYTDSLESAVRHLHSLGLAHNDLNASHIMLTKDGIPVVIDFSSCKPFGRKFISGGACGREWTSEDYDTSSQMHDQTALQKIYDWMGH